MAKYIDKSILEEEIRRQISAIDDCPKLTNTQIAVLEGDKVVLTKLLSFLDTLETKDVDLDMEVALWANAIPEIRLDDIERLAKYFFELGLKAQKRE